MLQQIFGTQVYEAMADELKELAKERTGLVRDALDRIGAAAEEFVHAAWPEPSDEPDDPAAEQMGTGDAGPGTTEVHGGGITGTRPGLPTGTRNYCWEKWAVGGTALTQNSMERKLSGGKGALQPLFLRKEK